MNTIPTEVINDIRNRARIEDVVGHYISVMKKGSNYVAFCPFHDDHDPSLHIAVDKQIFKCFSCPAEEGSAGDVFKFVMKYKHVDYVEAIKTVAEMIGYKYDFGTNNTKQFEETVTHRLNRDTVDFCMHELNSKDGVIYKEYLQNRQIDSKIQEKFEIGYNPTGNKLYNFLVKKGYKDSDIIEANLARLTNMGIRDVFFDRIMIPICDGYGHPIGFTARSIDKDNPSKYINSTDTPVFSKSNAIFNLHRAKEAAREKKYVIICEGPMDVIAFDRAGLSNAVCSLGTAVTKQQLEALRKVSVNLVLAFDGDKAGQGAIVRTGKLAQQFGFQISVINNQTGNDPDEIINQHGPSALVSMIEKPLTWLEFVMAHYQKEYDLNNYSAKKDYTLKVLEEIKKVKDSFDRDNYLQKLSQLTGFSISLLAQDMPETTNVVSADHQSTKKTVERPKVTTTGIVLAEKNIIKQMLYSKNSTNLYKEKIENMPDELLNSLALKIINYYQQNDEMVYPNFIGEYLESNEMIQLFYDISENDNYGNGINEDLLNDSMIEIELFDLKQKKFEIERKVGTLNDDIVKAKYAGEIVDINRKMQELRRKKSRR